VDVPSSTRVAELILDSFDSYMTAFSEINLRAPLRFRQRDWLGMQADTVERLELYGQSVGAAVGAISGLMGDHLSDRSAWGEVKGEYSREIISRDDWDLAETYFNSITRRVFATVGVDSAVEFVASEFDDPPSATAEDVYDTYQVGNDIAAILKRILIEAVGDVTFDSLDTVVCRIEEKLVDLGRPAIRRLEAGRSVFYRGQAAYILGRLVYDDGHIPLALALRHGTAGVGLDAVLLTENEVSILFSFTRSYFHVATPRPYDLVRFLKVLMPLKRVAELYIAIGHNKHGKTELYRDLLRHLDTSADRFEYARGTPGLVMIVFTMPGYDDVFKVIRDRFAPPKKTTRRSVMEKYRLVFRHDRAGRLMDVQDFQHLEFERDRFDPDLLAELLEDAGSIVRLDGDFVVLSHVYVERRIVPLDVYVRSSEEGMARAAILDYGQAIKDLASTNIFPGDLLMKNFGVTRHGRVVFYDYDELCALTEVTFRRIPPARNDDEAMSDQPWFAAANRDVFPEEHSHFLGLTGGMRETFEDAHSDLFEVEPWQRIQGRIEKGEIIEVFPYTEGARLPGAPPFEGW
jgi:isocitrate dehydrogenase kinase/phosphatase